MDSQKKAIYKYSFKDGFDLQNKVINIDLLNLLLRNNLGNPLAAHRWSFLPDPVNSIFSRESIISPLLGAVALGAGATAVTALATAPVTALATAPVVQNPPV